MADEGVEIRLSTVGAEEIQRTLAGLSQQFTSVASTIETTISRAAFAALGNFATLTGALYAGVQAFKSLVTAGIEARDMLDRSAISLGIVLESLNKYPGEMDQHAAAMKDAAEQIAILKSRSGELLGSLESLISANQRLAPAMAAAGVASQKQATDFTMLTAKIADVTRQSYESVAMQMSRLITMGRLSRGEFAMTLRSMGVTDEVIRSWKALGNDMEGQSILLKNLTEKFKSYEKGQKELLDTQAGMWKTGWKTLQGIVREALDGVDSELFAMARRWRDTIVGHKEELTTAVRDVFNAAVDTAKIVWETLSTIVGTTWKTLSSIIGDSADTSANRIVEAFANVAQLILKTYKVFAETVLLLFKTVYDATAPFLHPLDVAGTALGASAGSFALSGRAGLTGIEGAMPEGAEDVLGAEGEKAEELAQKVADATLVGNDFVKTSMKIADAMTAVNESTAGAVKELEKFKKAIPAERQMKALDAALRADDAAVTGAGQEFRKRVPQVPPPDERVVKAMQQAQREVEKFQALLAGIGMGPETTGVAKIKQQFLELGIEITKVGETLHRAGAAPKFIKDIAEAMESLRQAILKAKLDEFADLLSTRIAVSLADLDSKFQQAGSSAAVFAETVKGLADLDQTAKTLKDQADAFLEAGLEIGRMMTDEGARVEWLMAVWSNYYALREKQEGSLAGARERFTKQQEIKQREALALEQQNWNNYLTAVYDKNRLAGQGVVEAWQAALSQTASKMTANALTIEEGLAAGLRSFQASIGTVGKDVAGAVEKLGEGLTETLSSTFFDVITGKVNDLGDVFRKFGEMILKTLTDVFAKIVVRWILTGQAIEANPLQAGTGGKGLLGMFSGFGGGGGEAAITQGDWPISYTDPSQGLSAKPPVGSGWGPLLALGGGIGLGLGMNNLANSQNAMQTLAGGMQTLGGATLMTAAMFANVIPVWGQIAAAILILVGTIIAALSKSEIKVPVYAADAYKNQSSPQGLAMMQSYGGALLGLAQITQAGGGDVTRALNILRGGEIPDEYFRSQQVTIHAGSQEDIQKDWEAYLKTYLPRAMMSWAFGRQEVGRSGPGNDALTPGISGAPIFGDVDFSKGHEAMTPIVQMLQDLGFANDKIQEIARQIDARDPKEFVEWLTAMVTAVRSMQDSIKKLGRSAAEIVADQEALEKQSPAEAFRQPIQDLLDMAEAIKGLTGDEKVAKTKEFSEAVADLIKQEEAAVMRLHEMSEAIKEQARSLRESADAALRTPTEQLTYIGPRIAENFQKIIDATNPADVQKAWDQFYSDMTFVINGIVARIQAMRALIADMKSMQEAIANGPMADPQRNPFMWLAQNQQQIERATTAFRGAKKDTDEQVNAARTLFGLIQQRYQFELQMLERIRSVIESVNQTYEDWVFQTTLGGMTNEHDKGHALLARIQQLQEQLRGAKSPEEAERIFNQILGLANQMLNQPQDPANAEAARQFVLQLMADTKKIFDAVTGNMEDATETNIATLGAQLDGFIAEFGTALDTMTTDLGAALALLDTAATNASTKLDSFANALVTEMGKLTKALQDLTKAITGQPTKPKPADEPGFTWEWDAASGEWKKVPITGPNPGGNNPNTTNPNAPAPVHAPPNGPAAVTAGGPTLPLTINVDVTSGSPEEVAAAVADNVIEPLKLYVINALRRNSFELARTLREQPQLIAPWNATVR